VVDFFNKLMGLWNEVENYVKHLVCTCDATKKYVKMVEDDKVQQFLMGLYDDVYSNVRSQILAGWSSRGGCSSRGRGREG